RRYGVAEEGEPCAGRVPGRSPGRADRRRPPRRGRCERVMPTATRVHDCLINVHFRDAEQPGWMFRVKDEYFKRDDSIFGPWDMPQVLDEMDANGVERAIVTANVNERTGSPVRFAEARPDRFALAAGGLNLLRPMPSLRLLQSFVA